MSDLPIKNRLEAAHRGRGSPLFTMIAGRARQRGLIPAEACRDGVVWDAAWWGLDRWPRFAALDGAGQTGILRGLTRHLLNEAYFIEKSGTAYAAKMMILAPDTDTAQLYGLIAGDEATHLAWIEPFIAEADKTQPAGDFLAYLSALIEDASPQVLILLVQIVLEGWGLDHYRRLAAGCLNPDLKALFQAILKDEALHHHSGVVQFDARRLQAGEWALIERGLHAYADMVRAGPAGAVEVISQYMEINSGELSGLRAALGHPAETRRKLGLLRGLMDQPGLEPLLTRIDFNL